MNIQRGVIVALSNVETAQKVKIMLCDEGYDVLSICSTGGELIRKAIQYAPELVVTSYKMPDMTVLDIYDALADQCSFLVVVNELYRSYIKEEMDVYCINSPISKPVLINAVDLIFQSKRKILKLREQVEKLENKMEERKLIDKAKGILMLNKGLSEMEAFRYIQKMSMDSGHKMSEIAEKILLSDF